jgi:hypothetical protein
MPAGAMDKVLYGTGGEKIRVEYEREHGSGTFNAPFEGIITNLERRYRETSSEGMKEDLESYMANTPCPDCHGRRLKREALAVTVGDRSIADVSAMSVADARSFFHALTRTKSGHDRAQVLRRWMPGWLPRGRGLTPDLARARAHCRRRGPAHPLPRSRLQLVGYCTSWRALDRPAQRDKPQPALHPQAHPDLATPSWWEHDEETMLEADTSWTSAPARRPTCGYV